MAVGQGQGHSVRCKLILAQCPAFPTSGLTRGQSRHTHQLAVGCARELWGCGLRERRARPEGKAAGAAGRLGRAGGSGRGAVCGSCCQGNKALCVPRGLASAVPSGDASRGAHLPRSLRPWRAELGLWEPFSGRPHLQAGNQVFIHHPLLGSSIPGWAQSPGGVGQGREGVAPGLGRLRQPRMRKEHGHQADNWGSEHHSASSRLWDLRKVPNQPLQVCFLSL